MERKELHKRGKGKKVVTELRHKWKSDSVAISKEKRAQLLDAKRVRHSPAASPSHGSELDELDDLSIDQVDKAIGDLKSADDRLSALKTLQRAFAQGSQLTEHFLRKDGSLECLVGILSGGDAALQLEAVWCITNMAAGDHEQCFRIATAVAAYIVTYLTTCSYALQEQCAWAIGNIAGDSDECRDILLKQGAIEPLITLLQSPYPGCAQNAAFALSNFARGSADIRRELLSAGVLTNLLPLLKESPSEEIATEVSWVLAYLSASSELETQMMESGVVDLMLKLLQIHAEDQDINNNTLVTPVLRFLGNVFSGPDELTEQACRGHPVMVSLLCKFLASNHRHVVKETLWVLSNLAGDLMAGRIIMETGILPQLVDLLSAPYDIKLEAAYCLCQIAMHTQANWSQEMLSAGCISAFVPLLKAHDREEIRVALTYLGSMFAVLGTACAKEFREAGGLTNIEPLEYHNDEEIRAETNSFLEAYIYKDEASTN